MAESLGARAPNPLRRHPAPYRPPGETSSATEKAASAPAAETEAAAGALQRAPLDRGGDRQPTTTTPAGFHPATATAPYRAGTAGADLVLHRALVPLRSAAVRRTAPGKSTGSAPEATASLPGRLLRRTPLGSAPTADYSFGGQLLRASFPQRHAPQAPEGAGRYPLAASAPQPLTQAGSVTSFRGGSALSSVPAGPAQSPPAPFAAPTLRGNRAPVGGAEARGLLGAGVALSQRSAVSRALATGLLPGASTPAASVATSALLRFPAGAIGSWALRRTPFPPTPPSLPGQEAAAMLADPDAGLPLAVPRLSSRHGSTGSSALLQRRRSAAASTPIQDLEEAPEQAAQEQGGSASGPGPDALADKVWRILMLRLTVERERRGVLRWS